MRLWEGTEFSEFYRWECARLGTGDWAFLLCFLWGASKLWLKENLAEPEAGTVGRGVAEAIPKDPLAAASFWGCQSVLFAFLLWKKQPPHRVPPAKEWHPATDSGRPHLKNGALARALIVPHLKNSALARALTDWFSHHCFLSGNRSQVTCPVSESHPSHTLVCFGGMTFSVSDIRSHFLWRNLGVRNRSLMPSKSRFAHLLKNALKYLVHVLNVTQPSIPLPRVTTGWFQVITHVLVWTDWVGILVSLPQLNSGDGFPHFDLCLAKVAITPLWEPKCPQIWLTAVKHLLISLKNRH